MISHLNDIFFKQPWFWINKSHTHVDIHSWTSLSQNMIEACIILSQKICILCQARCCNCPISSVHYGGHHMIISLLRIWKSYQWVDENKGRVISILKGKVKAVPLQAWSGPEGSRKLRFPDFMTMAQGGSKVVSLTHQLHLPPGNPPGTHFC